MGVWGIFGLASETRENGGFLADNIKGHALTGVPFLARLPFRWINLKTYKSKTNPIDN